MCSVVGCDSLRRNAKRFKLPEDPEERLEWVQFVLDVNGQRLKESTWTDITICSEHFTNDCFVNKSPTGRLKPGSVPSLSVKSEPEEVLENLQHVESVENTDSSCQFDDLETSDSPTSCPEKKRVQKRRKPREQRRREEKEERREEQEADLEREAEAEEDQEEEIGQDSDMASTSTGKRQLQQTYSFRAEEEKKLVAFFATHDCFYNKASPHYSNIAFKKKLLQGIARQLDTEYTKIQGWFKNQRSAVGKLYKKKSGQAAEPLTARKKWQLASFRFLRRYIMPRSYTQDTGALPARASDTEEEEEPEVEGETEEDGASATGSTVKTPCSSGLPSSQRGTKRSRKVEDALLDYLSRPRSSQVLAKKIEALESAPVVDERTAFGQWFCARIAKVPDSRWEDFHDEVQGVLREYTRVEKRPSRPSTRTPDVEFIPPQQQQQQQQPSHIPPRQRPAWQWQQHQQWQQPQQQQDVPIPPSCHCPPVTDSPQTSQPPYPQSADVGSLPPWTYSFIKMLNSHGFRQTSNTGPSDRPPSTPEAPLVIDEDCKAE